MSFSLARLIARTSGRANERCLRIGTVWFGLSRERHNMTSGGAPSVVRAAQRNWEVSITLSRTPKAVRMICETFSGSAGHVTSARVSLKPFVVRGGRASDARGAIPADE